MQKVEAKTVTLKNGLEVVIRQARLDDAENLLTCVKHVIPQSEYIPKLEHEITSTVEYEAEWISSFLITENALLLVAEHNGQIVGNIDTTCSKRTVMAHTACIGMGMLQEWRNTGLGTALLQTTIDWAKQHSAIELLWLQVYTANTLGIGLYRKMGFVETGLIKKYFKHGDTYYDCLTMALDVT